MLNIKAILAYLGVVIVWSTTPLTIQWSQDSFSSAQALFWRMFLAWLVVLFYLLFKKKLPSLTKATASLFAIAGVGLFVAMALIYSAAPFIDTGLVAIIHGLLPLLTAVFSLMILALRLSLFQWLALCISLLGMAVLFIAEAQLSWQIGLPFLAVLIAVSAHALTAVLIKKHGVTVAVSQQLFGALGVTSVCLAVWVVFKGEPFLPAALSVKSGVSIGYLALAGSVLGFFCYYYLLQKVSPVTVGTITLLTPLSSMFIGLWVNDETFPLGTIVGTLVLLFGLAIYLMAKPAK